MEEVTYPVQVLYCGGRLEVMSTTTNTFVSVWPSS